MSTTSKSTETQPPPELRLRLAFTIVIEKDGASFHAFCPGLKGLHVGGKTEDEALENAKAAAYCYVDSLVRHGDPLPIGPHFTADREEEIPPGALLRHIEVQCAIQNELGNS